MPPHGLLSPVDREQMMGESAREIVEIGEIECRELTKAVGHRLLF
jgi:hypothetical protein